MNFNKIKCSSFGNTKAKIQRGIVNVVRSIFAVVYLLQTVANKSCLLDTLFR